MLKYTHKIKLYAYMHKYSKLFIILDVGRIMSLKIFFIFSQCKIILHNHFQLVHENNN